MVVVRAKFDGTKVIFPETAQGLPAGEVLVIFQNGNQAASEAEAWKAAGESAFLKAWDNPENAVYDTL